jgi:hypothetical protein
MAPLLLRDRARDGTVPVAMAYAAGALRTLRGCVDGGTAVVRNSYNERVTDAPGHMVAYQAKFQSMQ